MFALLVLGTADAYHGPNGSCVNSTPCLGDTGLAFEGLELQGYPCFNPSGCNSLVSRLEAVDTQLERRGPGPCINAQDEKHFPELVPDLQACGKEVSKYHLHGLRELGAIKKCLVEQKGFTGDCTRCTAGGLAACRALHCKVCNPGMKLYEEDCFTCVADCTLKMTKCGGIDTAPMATCEKMLTGDLGWVCDVIHKKKTIQQVFKELEPILKPKTPAPKSLERRGPGLCINEQDEKRFPNLVADMTDCGKSIKKDHLHGLRELGALKKCLVEQKGFTGGCTRCTGGGLGACRARFCNKKCTNGITKDCFECDAGCVLKMTKCGGIDDAPMATCQKMMTGELSWACDVIHKKKTIEQTWKEIEPLVNKDHPKAMLEILDIDVEEEDVARLTF